MQKLNFEIDVSGKGIILYFLSESLFSHTKTACPKRTLFGHSKSRASFVSNRGFIIGFYIARCGVIVR
jgi:hypothetical protein